MPRQDPTSDCKYAKLEILAVQSLASNDPFRPISQIIGCPKTVLESYNSTVYPSANTVWTTSLRFANPIVDIIPFLERLAM